MTYYVTLLGGEDFVALCYSLRDQGDGVVERVITIF